MKTTELRVEGMSCGSCINHIDRALRALSGVRQVEVNLRDATVRVAHDPDAVDVAALIAGIAAEGYEARALP
jgi:copper chaperone